MERTFGFLEHLVCDTTFSMLLVYPNKADAPHRAFGRLLNADGGGVAVPRTPLNRSAPLNPIIRRWFCAMNQRKISFGFFADEFAPIGLPKNGHYFSDYLALRLVKVEFPHRKSRECPHSCPRIGPNRKGSRRRTFWALRHNRRFLRRLRRPGGHMER